MSDDKRTVIVRDLGDKGRGIPRAVSDLPEFVQNGIQKTRKGEGRSLTWQESGELKTVVVDNEGSSKGRRK